MQSHHAPPFVQLYALIYLCPIRQGDAVIFVKLVGLDKLQREPVSAIFVSANKSNDAFTITGCGPDRPAHCSSAIRIAGDSEVFRLVPAIPVIFN